MDTTTEVYEQLIRSAARRLKGHARRLFQAEVADALCHGSPRAAERRFGFDRNAVATGQHEAQSGIRCVENFAARARPCAEVKDPAIVTALERLLANDIAGDPMSQERWVRSSLTHLSERLREMGYVVSRKTVGRILRSMGFSRKSNKRKQPRPKCPIRNEQFEYIAVQRESFTAAGLPVISVDTKKEELIGPFRNRGQCWCREADEVDEHDFPSAAECQAVPFGVYDVIKNKGYVVVGTSNNTPEFAVNSVVRWWETVGRSSYSAAGQVLILADGGGGNGSRSRAWKLNLQVKLCDRFGLAVTVCHYPPGCSKWNPVEHRLFSYISVNWAGKPLRTLEIMLGYIRGTTTRTGLKVEAVLDDATYRRGLKVSRDQARTLNLRQHDACPQWNYTLSPRAVPLSERP